MRRKIGLALLLLCVSLSATAGSGESTEAMCARYVYGIDEAKKEMADGRPVWTAQSMRANLDAWASQADPSESMLRFPWYLPMLHSLIEIAFQSEDWVGEGIRTCLSYARGERTQN